LSDTRAEKFAPQAPLDAVEMTRMRLPKSFAVAIQLLRRRRQVAVCLGFDLGSIMRRRSEPSENLLSESVGL
jgi:hypothetical protein